MLKNGKVVIVGALAFAIYTPFARAQVTTVLACVSTKDGAMRNVASTTACKNNETLLQWNVRGPTGPSGPQGATGPQGPAGVGIVSGAILYVPTGNPAPAGFTKLGRSNINLTGHTNGLNVDVYIKN